MESSWRPCFKQTSTSTHHNCSSKIKTRLARRILSQITWAPRIANRCFRDRIQEQTLITLISQAWSTFKINRSHPVLLEKSTFPKNKFRERLLLKKRARPIKTEPLTQLDQCHLQKLHYKIKTSSNCHFGLSQTIQFGQISMIL